MASKKEKLLKIEQAYKMGWISKETYESGKRRIKGDK